MLEPAHSDGEVAVIVTEGGELTLTTAVVVDVQPAALVPVTV
jgi:hypothetical protein